MDRKNEEHLMRYRKTIDEVYADAITILTGVVTGKLHTIEFVELLGDLPMIIRDFLPSLAKRKLAKAHFVRMLCLECYFRIDGMPGDDVEYERELVYLARSILQLLVRDDWTDEDITNFLTYVREGAREEKWREYDLVEVAGKAGPLIIRVAKGQERPGEEFCLRNGTASVDILPVLEDSLTTPAIVDSINAAFVKAVGKARSANHVSHLCFLRYPFLPHGGAIPFMGKVVCASYTPAFLFDAQHAFERFPRPEGTPPRPRKRIAIVTDLLVPKDDFLRSAIDLIHEQYKAKVAVIVAYVAMLEKLPELDVAVHTVEAYQYLTHAVKEKQKGEDS